MTGKKGEEIELGRCQLNLFAIYRDLAGLQVNLEGATCDLLGCTCPPLNAAKHRTNTCNKLPRAERLHHVVVGTQLQANDPTRLPRPWQST